MSDDFQKNEISWRDTAQDTPAPERTGYERMFHSAVAALAEISDALGIPEDVASTANGNAEILHAIRALLKERDALAAKVASYERADRDLNEALNMGDGSYRP